eukprot:TRINITY_DN14107_c0_g1_i1.p1 TRINITY_DN14107_c0_g1~~TRINITY_DN14107_c0_g1_i1.p1  ORF type:complete len:609 (-),score=106.44 TRINITY_DN14107_c0_g1_i1:59-1885(-)
MGVHHGFFSYVMRNKDRLTEPVNVADLCNATGKPLILDQSAVSYLYRKWELDWRFGGQPVQFSMRLRQWLDVFVQRNVRVEVYLDGLPLDGNTEKVIKRSEHQIQHLRALLDEPCVPIGSIQGLFPSAAARAARQAFVAAGMKVTQIQKGEADEAIAAKCLASQALAVVTRDSDFFCYEIPVIAAELLDVSPTGIMAGLFSVPRRLEFFNFQDESWKLCLLPALLGNDSIDSYTDLNSLQRQLVHRVAPKKRPHSPQIIQAVIAFIGQQKNVASTFESIAQLVSFDLVLLDKIRGLFESFRAPQAFTDDTVWSFHGVALPEAALTALLQRFEDGQLSGSVISLLEQRCFKCSVHIEPEGGLLSEKRSPDLHAFTRLATARQRCYGLLFYQFDFPVDEVIRQGENFCRVPVPVIAPAAQLADRSPLEIFEYVFARPGFSALWQHLQPPGGIGPFVPHLMAIMLMLGDYPQLLQPQHSVPVQAFLVASFWTSLAPLVLPACTELAEPSARNIAYSLPSVAQVYLQHVLLVNALAGFPLPAPSISFDAVVYQLLLLGETEAVRAILATDVDALEALKRCLELANQFLPSEYPTVAVFDKESGSPPKRQRTE